MATTLQEQGMAYKYDQMPVRNNLDGDNIKWRDGCKPDYSTVDALYLKGKKMCHAPGSPEKAVENLVKQFEVESSHKVREGDWQTIAPANFRMSVNGGPKATVKHNIERGNLSLFMSDSPLYDSSMDDGASRKRFQQAFKNGFAWELLEIQSGKEYLQDRTGPPDITFTWRHWGRFEGSYGKNSHPTGQMIEMFGSCVVRLTDQLKIQSLEMYQDPNPMLATLMNGKRPGWGCPVLKKF